MEPGDTGSDLALLSHWGERGTEEEPSPETRQRLLDAALDHPAWLPQVLERHKRTLTPDEFNRLLDFIEQHEIDDLPRLDTPVADGVQYEYLHLTPHGGRRIFMNNPDHAAGSVYDVLTSLFLELGCS